MFKRCLLATVAAAVLLSFSVGNALASDMTVTQAIKAEDRSVNADPTFKSLGNFKITTAAQAKAFIPKLRKLESFIDNAATVVARASATSSQAAGQKDWVAGDRLQGKGIGEIAVALTDLLQHNKTAGQTALDKALKLIANGEKLTLKADKLLGLPRAT